jgi:putative aldouronate transport system substrate-binding protein
MQKATRLIGMLACVAILLSTVLTGCNSPTPAPTTAPTAAPVASVEPTKAPEPAIDTSKSVNLIEYLMGGPAKDYDAMLAALNTKMKADINATVTVNWIGWGDFTTKYPLILASGEPVDLIYAATWTQFYQNAQKGAYLAIEDLAPKYAPKSMASYTPDWLAQATVNGHLYAFPANFSQVGMMGIIVRGDLMKKYNIPDIKTLDDYGAYLDAVVKNEPTLVPSDFVGSTDGLDSYFVRSIGHYRPITQWIYYNIDNGQAVDELALPEMQGFYEKMKDWSAKGYWPKSVASNKDDQMLQNGTAASRLHNQDTWNGAYMKHPEFDLKFYWTDSYGVSTVAMQDGMAIPASAQNPERALMLLDKLKMDQSYYNLVAYGVEGTDYTFTSDNMVDPKNTDVWAPDGYCNWGVKSVEFFKPVKGSAPTYLDVKAKLKAVAINDPYALFTLNQDPIKNELAALNSVMVQYEVPLNYGFVDDVAAGIATLKQKMKEAGIDKVMTEIQKQLDAFKAANVK